MRNHHGQRAADKEIIRNEAAWYFDHGQSYWDFNYENDWSDCPCCSYMPPTAHDLYIRYFCDDGNEWLRDLIVEHEAGERYPDFTIRQLLELITGEEICFDINDSSAGWLPKLREIAPLLIRDE